MILRNKTKQGLIDSLPAKGWLVPAHVEEKIQWSANSKYFELALEHNPAEPPDFPGDFDLLKAGDITQKGDQFYSESVSSRTGRVDGWGDILDRALGAPIPKEAFGMFRRPK